MSIDWCSAPLCMEAWWCRRRTTMTGLSIVTGRFCDHERAKQAVLFVERSCGEDQRVGWTCVRAVAECQPPQAFDLDRPTLRRMERTAVLEFSAFVQARIVRVNAAVAEVADQQIAAELPEVSGREGE